jgi:hypothetical protein
MIKNILILIVFNSFFLKVSAQNIEYSQNVKAKMDQNKIDGLSIMNGIEFHHEATILLGLSSPSYKNNDPEIQSGLNEIKMLLGFESVLFEHDDKGDIKVNFLAETEKQLDQLKIALHNKNFIGTSFKVIAKLK